MTPTSSNSSDATKRYKVYTAHAGRNPGGRGIIQRSHTHARWRYSAAGGGENCCAGRQSGTENCGVLPGGGVSRRTEGQNWRRQQECVMVDRVTRVVEQGEEGEGSVCWWVRRESRSGEN